MCINDTHWKFVMYLLQNFEIHVISSTALSPSLSIYVYWLWMTSNKRVMLSDVFVGSAREISTTRIFESLEKLQESSSDEEFFDAEGKQIYKLWIQWKILQ